MPAYVIGEISIHDPEGYEAYRASAGATVLAHGGRYLVRGGAVESCEGEAVTGRMVVLEFPDVAAAKAWYESDDYRAVMPIRVATSDSRMFIVEGFEGAVT